MSPEAILTSPSDGPPAAGGSLFSVVPSSSAVPTFRSTSSLTPLVCDERVIARLLEALISRSNMSLGAVAQRLGVTPNAIRQYLKGRRNKPSLLWFVRLAEVCGAKVSIEFPKR